MALAQQQKSFENPFQQCTAENDVVVKVGDETLHLKSSILSFYSPVLKEEIENQQNEEKNDRNNMMIKIDEKKLESVVIFFMFFYPEFELKILHEQLMILDCDTIKEVICLSETYKVDWVRSQLHYVLSCPKHIEIFTETTVKTIEVLMLANAYKLGKMAKMTRERAAQRFRFSSLQNEKQFQELKGETKFSLACNFCSKRHYEEHYKTDMDTATSILNDVNDEFEEEDEKVRTVDEIKIEEDSDVIVKVEDQTLNLHSAILCHCSPVFKAMLTGNFKEAITKEIVLKDKKAKHVIILFGFCYSNDFQTLTASTDYEELLKLCEEYQMDWLKQIIEQYLIDSKRFHDIIYESNRKSIARNVDKGFKGLFLADKFELNGLRKALCLTYGNWNLTSMYNDKDNFKKLSKASKYHLARSSMNNWEYYEKLEVLNCLDTFTKY